VAHCLPLYGCVTWSRKLTWAQVYQDASVCGGACVGVLVHYCPCGARVCRAHCVCCVLSTSAQKWAVHPFLGKACWMVHGMVVLAVTYVCIVRTGPGVVGQYLWGCAPLGLIPIFMPCGNSYILMFQCHVISHNRACGSWDMCVMPWLCAVWLWQPGRFLTRQGGFDSTPTWGSRSLSALIAPCCQLSLLRMC